jgi:hypothetical protein
MKNTSIIFNGDYDVQYRTTKSRIKIQLVYVETKMANCIVR